MVISTKISENILIITGEYFDEHMTIINTTNGLVVVDTLTTPLTTRVAKELICAFSSKTTRYLINTHFDVDHYGGNQLFSGVEIIGHENCKNHYDGDFFGRSENAEELKEYIASLETNANSREDPLNHRKKKYIESYRSMLRGFDNFKFTPPSYFIKNSTTLEMEDTSIKIFYLGPGHTDADLIIYIPSEKLLITGDLVLGNEYITVIHGVHGGNASNFINILEYLQKMGDKIQTIIPGHGAIAVPSILTNHLNYIKKLQQEVFKFKRQGYSLEQAKMEIQFAEFEQYYLYDLAHATNIEAVWNENSNEQIQPK